MGMSKGIATLQRIKSPHLLKVSSVLPVCVIGIEITNYSLALFRVVLWSILNTKCVGEIIAWSEDGNYIVIKDWNNLPNALLNNEISGNIDSFKRQLNNYGFRKEVKVRLMKSLMIIYDFLF